MASAFPVTITQILYYNGNNAGSATGSPAYSCTSNSSQGTPETNPLACTSLTATNWSATYAFNGYGFYNTGFGLSSVGVVAIDHVIADVALANNSNSNTWDAFEVGAITKFGTANTLLSGVNTSAGVFLTDGLQAAGSTPASFTGGCAADGTPLPGHFDSTGCIYLTSSGGGANADPSGFVNTTNGSVGLNNSLFTGAGAVDLYEYVVGHQQQAGTNVNSTPNSSVGSELILTYTYDNGIHSATPEPATLLLLGSALSFLGAKLRRRAVK
jgi:hypothetical protein